MSVLVTFSSACPSLLKYVLSQLPRGVLRHFKYAKSWTKFRESPSFYKATATRGFSKGHAATRQINHLCKQLCLASLNTSTMFSNRRPYPSDLSYPGAITSLLFKILMKSLLLLTFSFVLQTFVAHVPVSWLIDTDWGLRIPTDLLKLINSYPWVSCQYFSGLHLVMETINKVKQIGKTKHFITMTVSANVRL